MESILILIAAPVLIYLTLRLAWWWMGARARYGESLMYGDEYRKMGEFQKELFKHRYYRDRGSTREPDDWEDAENWAMDLAMRDTRSDAEVVAEWKAREAGPSLYERSKALLGKIRRNQFVAMQAHAGRLTEQSLAAADADIKAYLESEIDSEELNRRLGIPPLPPSQGSET